MTNCLSYPSKISVIFTDSIPLFAVFFKVFRNILPEQFQYFGLWGLVCFMLQSFFSAKIMDKLVKKRFIAFVCAVAFSFSPVLIMRMYYHTALAGHWIILLAIDNFFSSGVYSKKTVVFWTILGALCPFVHFFFFGICAIVLCGFCVKIVINCRDARFAFLCCIGYLSGCIVATAVLGGFSCSGLVSASESGLGEYSMNLNAFLNPQGWSVFFNTLPYNEPQGEGFAYVGAGFLFLIVVAAVLVFQSDCVMRKYLENKAGVVSVAVVFALAFIAAASNVITINDRTLFSIPIPFPIERLWSVFRSSGRFSWICVYLLMIFSVVFVVETSKTKFAVVAVFLALVIQFVDIRPQLAVRRTRFSSKISYVPPVTDEKKWKVLAKKSGWKYLYLSEQVEKTVLYDFSQFCLYNGKAMNRFYFAHGKNEIIERNFKEALAKKDENALFVFPASDENVNMEKEMYLCRIGAYMIGSFKDSGVFD